LNRVYQLEQQHVDQSDTFGNRFLAHHLL